MAAAGEAFLERGEAVLPAGDARIGGEAVLDEAEASPRPEHPADLGEGALDIRNRTESPGGDGRIDRAVGEGDRLRGLADELHRKRRPRDGVPGEPPRRRRRLDGIE